MSTPPTVPTAPKPEFAANVDDHTVADAINGHLGWLSDTRKEPVDVAIATAYFNAEGYACLSRQLDKCGAVRLLLGAEPEGVDRHVRRLKEESLRRAGRARLRTAMTEQEAALASERNLLGFSLEADALARRLVDWLSDDRVEVRRFTSGFLHGKAFMVTTDDEGVIAGSSNFTKAGLTTNVELNLGQYQPHVVKQVRKWFDDLWDAAEPYDLADVYAARFAPHLPQTIYMRMLLARYGAELDEEQRQTGFSTLQLATFQKDGVWRAKRTLDEYGGVVIADEVGLGKTYIGGALIREAIEDRRQRVLVIAPAALRDGPWRVFGEVFGLKYDCISFDQLADELGPKAKGWQRQTDPSEYAMVVIDEAHAFRNPDTGRATALRNLLAGIPPKQLVMLTATPVNNSLWDLYYLLTLFVHDDARFADRSIMSLRGRFKEAEQIDPEDLTPEHLFDVIDAIAVRRTRSFIKRHYPNDTIVGPGGQEIVIRFPQPVVTKITYDLSEAYPELLPRVAHALAWSPDEDSSDDVVEVPDDARVLRLARYMPSLYRLDAETEANEVTVAGLLRSGLLKRFESSARAFELTCRRMADSNEQFLKLLDRGVVATGAALRDLGPADSDDLDDLIQGDLDDLYGDAVGDTTDYRLDDLKQHVQEDVTLLREFADAAAACSPENDPKLAALADELALIAKTAKDEAVSEDDERDKRKTLVFTYFADTAKWVFEWLRDEINRRDDLAVFRGRIACVTGTDRDDRCVWGFAPNTTDAPAGYQDDLYDILIATDVLAEGVNLQQARNLTSFDLPWNPQRLVQRHGRIDRLASPHTRVFIRCVFPDAQLDVLLKLEERLRRKITQAAKSVGIAREVLPGTDVSDHTFAHTRSEILGLAAGDASLLEHPGGVSALSGEEFRQQLRSYLKMPGGRERLEELPWGAGSGFVRPGANHGFVFCAQVGDHPTPIFRYVEMAGLGSGDREVTRVEPDVLLCFAHAQPINEDETPRSLSDEQMTSAFAAWESARDSIYSDWTHATDHRNLQPAIPKVLRDAAALIRKSPPPGVSQEELDKQIDAIEAPLGKRHQNLIRKAMHLGATDQSRAESVLEAARQLGLQRHAPPEPLPPIATDDIHLICWQAIAPELDELDQDWGEKESLLSVEQGLLDT